MNHQDGGVTVMLGMILIGIFLPLMLIVGDVGRIVVEKRQLQNSADSAAFTAAFECARAVMNPSAHFCDQGTADGLAQEYADQNDSHDRNTHLLGGVDLTTPNQVTVTTRSREGTENSIGMWVAGALVGADRVEVDARATAAWGGAATGDVLPFILPHAQWENLAALQKANWPLLTNDQGLFPEDGPFPPLNQQAPVITLMKGDNPNGSFGSLASTSYCNLSASIWEPVTSSGNAFGCKNPGSDNSLMVDVVEDKTSLLATYPSDPSQCTAGLPCPHTGTGDKAQYSVYAFVGIRVNAYYFSTTYWWPKNSVAGVRMWELAQPVCSTLLVGAPPPVSHTDPDLHGCIRGWLVAVDPNLGGIGGGSAGVQNVQLVK